MGVVLIPLDSLRLLVEQVDVMGGRARLGIGPDNCIQHMTITVQATLLVVLSPLRYPAELAGEHVGA